MAKSPNSTRARASDRKSPPAVNAAAGDADSALVADAATLQAFKHCGDAKSDELWNIGSKIADRMAAVPAASIAGIIAKAKAVAWCCAEDGVEPSDPERQTTDDVLAFSIVRDLLAIDAAQGAAPSPVAAPAPETFGAMEMEDLMIDLQGNAALLDMALDSITIPAAPGWKGVAVSVARDQLMEAVRQLTEHFYAGLERQPA